MHELKRPAGSVFTITAYIPAVTGLTVTYTLQNQTTASSNYLMYWNAGTVAWQSGTVSNPLIGVSSNPGLYTASVNHSIMPGSAVDDLFTVAVYEATQPYRDFFNLRFGDVVDTMISQIQNY